MTLIIYTEQCLVCFYKKRLARLDRFAQQNNLELVIKRTSYDKQLQQEAKDMSSLQEPFVYNETNGHSVEFMSDNWEGLLNGETD